MTKDEIIEMARQVKMPYYYQDNTIKDLDKLEAFANLVASAEREACANLCEQHGYEHYCGNVTDKLAKTIRARGQA